MGGLQSRLPLILPGIPPVFQRALERLALVPPPAAWADDYARFIVEHRDLLQRRMRLFGALNADRMDIAAGFAVDYEAVSFPSLWPLLSVLYNILVAFVFCYYAYYEVVRLFPVGIATIGMLATPVVGLFSGALLLGEALGWAEYSALALVVLALGIPVLARPRHVIIGTEVK